MLFRLLTLTTGALYHAIHHQQTEQLPNDLPQMGVKGTAEKSLICDVILKGFKAWWKSVYVMKRR